MHRPGRDLSWKEFGRRLRREYQKDRLNDQAAALTYYGVLALFPFLIFLVTVGGLLLDPERIAQLVDQVGRAAPAEVAHIVGGRLRQLHEQAGGTILALSVIGALWVASNGVASLQRALNRTYDVTETRPGWKVRLLCVGVTLAGALMAVVAALIMFAVPALGHFLDGGPIAVVLNIARFVVAGLLMVLFLGMLYRVLPDVRGRFHLFTFGALAAVPLWLLASWAFGFYASHFGKYGAVYGALAGIVVMLVWMWISSLVVLLGAEMNKVLTPRSELLGYPAEPRRERTRGPFEPQPA